MLPFSHDCHETRKMASYQYEEMIFQRVCDESKFWLSKSVEKKNNFTNFGYGKVRFWRSIWGYRHNKSEFFAVFFFLINFY